MTETLGISVSEDIKIGEVLNGACAHIPVKKGKDYFCSKCDRKLMVKFKQTFKR